MKTHHLSFSRHAFLGGTLVAGAALIIPLRLPMVWAREDLSHAYIRIDTSGLVTFLPPTFLKDWIIYEDTPAGELRRALAPGALTIKGDAGNTSCLTLSLLHVHICRPRLQAATLYLS